MSCVKNVQGLRMFLEESVLWTPGDGFGVGNWACGRQAWGHSSGQCYKCSFLALSLLAGGPWRREDSTLLAATAGAGRRPSRTAWGYHGGILPASLFKRVPREGVSPCTIEPESGLRICGPVSKSRLEAKKAGRPSSFPGDPAALVQEASLGTFLMDPNLSFWGPLIFFPSVKERKLPVCAGNGGHVWLPSLTRCPLVAACFLGLAIISPMAPASAPGPDVNPTCDGLLSYICLFCFSVWKEINF